MCDDYIEEKYWKGVFENKYWVAQDGTFSWEGYETKDAR